ncbi:MAG: LamG domain-containing protein [Lentisphaeraceae bacterium]|nr:LamG domain-containing protein [Lentisphaeraceae bacterium]
MLAVTKSLKRFALVEVMLSAAVLAILAVLVIPFFNRANSKSRFISWNNQKSLVLNDGDLDLYYDFADAEGKIVRNLARGIHKQEYDPINFDGRLHNAAVWGTGRWQMKPALEFDGQSGYLSGNAEFSKVSQSFNFWCKSDGQSGGLFMTSRRRNLDSFAGLSIQLKNGVLTSTVGKSVISTKQPLEKSKWMMVTLTTGVKFKKSSVYLNGELLGEVDSLLPQKRKQGSFIIGFTPVGGFFDGKVGEFMSWSRELSASEIQKLYKETHP